MKFRRDDKQSFSQAFTLIELLLGISIFSIIALTLYATFSNGITLNKRILTVESIYRGARWTFEALSQDLENMVPYHLPSSDGAVHEVIVNASTSRNVAVESGSKNISDKPPSIFVGESGRLSFVIPSEDGLKWVSYSLKQPEDVLIHQILVQDHSNKNQTIRVGGDSESARVNFLIRQEVPLSLKIAGDISDGVGNEVLSEYVLETGLKFSYAKMENNQDQRSVTWQDSWSENYFPAGVRMEITFIHPQDPQQKIAMKKDVLIPLGFWGTLDY